MNDQKKVNLTISVILSLVVVVLLSVSAYFGLKSRKQANELLNSFKKERWLPILTQQKAQNIAMSGASRKIEPADPVALNPVAAEIDEETCWSQIEREAGVQNFYEYNRNEWDYSIAMWYLRGEAWQAQYIPETIEAKFYMALGLSGLLTEQDAPKDFLRSYELIKEVVDKDSLNSAPILFAILIARKVGNQEKEIEWREKLKESTHFNTYVKNLARTIYGKIRSSSDYLQAIGLWAQVPLPDYGKLKDLLIEIGPKNVAEQMVRDGLDDQAQWNDIDWFVLDYATGAFVVKILDPARELPNHQDLVVRKNAMNKLNGELMVRDMRSSCRLSVVDPYEKELQEHLNRTNR